jgi:hypothetical protein
MLHDDPLSNHQACMISDIGLVQRVGDVATSGSEVSEVSYHHKVEIVGEVARVVTTRHGKQLRYFAQVLESIAKSLPCLRRDPFGPLIDDHLTEHEFTF